MTIQSRTRIRTGTAAEWSADNPILSIGELGIETDVLKMKGGNGVDAWNTLIYVNQAIISTVGLTGVYSDLTGKPTLGTAAATAIGDYATAAQGATADSALQPAGNGGSLTGLTKTQVGLANADNTTDAGKPVSTAAQTALDLKQSLSAKGQINGYAGLDGTAVVPLAQLPIGMLSAWGVITGVLSAQTDLQAELDGKQVAGSYATGAQGALADTALQTNAALGTPVSGVATNLTGTAAGLTSGNATLAATVTTNAILTGHVTSTGNAAILGSFTIAQLSTAISDANISGNNSGDQTSIVGISGTLAEFNTALSDANFASGGGTATGTNTGDQTTIAGITGTIAQFNTALTDGDFATGGGTATGTNTGDNATNTQYSGLAASKQDTLVSATNIKTINGSTVLGSGDLVVGGAVAWGSITGTLSAQTDLQTALNAKQATLVSATNIKTINGSTVLGSGDLTVSAGDPSYSPGSFTVATNTQRLAPHRIVLTTSQRITIEGTGRLSCLN